MKAKILTFVIIFFVSQTKSQIYLSGDVTSPLTLFDTVYVTGDVQVTGSGALTFLSGTIIISQGYFRITVSGTGKITAIGTQNDSIKFMVADTTGFSNFSSTSGSWAGIALVDQEVSADSSIFEFCSFSYSKGFQSLSIYSGGALNIHNSQKTRFSNCRFHHNFSDSGGGAAFLFNCNLIEKSVFANNYSSAGGGIYLHIGSIDSCIFINNVAEHGGGVYCFAGVLSNSIILNNSAEVHGGGVYFIQGLFENSQVQDNQAGMGGGGCYANGFCQINNCQFIANVSGDGGGLTSTPFFTDVVTVLDCLFENNTAQSGGGASVLNGNTSFNNCIFNENTAINFGGGLNANNCEVTNCSFNGNSCDPNGDGGGIFSFESDISYCYLTNNVARVGGGISSISSTIQNCQIKYNTSVLNGGGICSYDFANVDSCEISFNSAGDNGGGIYCFGNQNYKNCLISHNNSEEDGGGVYISLSGPVLENCIIDSNHADENGGGVVFVDGGIIINCLIINNSADSKGGGLYARGIYNINGKVTNSTICNNTVPNITNNAGGIYSQNEGDFINNVIWGNLSQVYVTGTNCSFNYCAVQDESSVNWGGASTNEIMDLNPENYTSLGPNFTDPSENDFTLLSSSKLINSGNPDTSNLSLPDYDLAGLARICADTVDIGAYENQIETGNNDLSLKTIVIYPNPAKSEIYIVDKSQSGLYQCSLINSVGQKVMTIRTIEQKNRIDLDHLENGIYFLLLINDDNKIVKKIIKK